MRNNFRVWQLGSPPSKNGLPLRLCGLRSALAEAKLRLVYGPFILAP
jgi:hypothetical protein